MKRKTIVITLTDEQAEKFKELFKKVEDAFVDDKAGSIIAQVERNYSSQKATVTATFLDNETTKKVREATGVNKK